MGNIISYHVYKCCKCNITINFQNDLEPYYLIGKGKYNNKYICFQCIKSVIDDISLVKHQKAKEL
jgi:DNA-directed RNA polymerase subunit RPC12/RpoP